MAAEDVTPYCMHCGAKPDDGKVEKLKVPLALLAKMRVQWFNGGGWIHGQVIAVYSNGTCDVESDTGNVLKGRPVQQLIAEAD